MKRKKTGNLNSDTQVGRYHSYNLHYACFSCRKMFNEPSYLRRFDRKGLGVDAITCPECRMPMRNMGKEFKPPRRGNIRQWRKVELLYQRGYRWEAETQKVWMTQGNVKVGYLVVATSRSPQARTLRDARTDYPPCQQL